MNHLCAFFLLAFSAVSEAQNPMLVVKSGDFPKDAPEIKALAAALGAPIIIEAEKNPVCCVWVEKTHTATPDGRPGYVFLKGEGAEVYLTDLKAASRLADRIRRMTGPVPKGLMTNYVTNASAAAGEEADGSPSKK